MKPCFTVKLFYDRIMVGSIVVDEKPDKRKINMLVEK